MKLRTGIVAVVLTLALSAGAQGRTEAAAQIKIGGIFALTGPTSDVGVPYSEGVKAYVSYINARGGVKGRKIDFVSQDYAYNVARGEQLYSQLKSSGVIAIQGWGTADTEALRTRVNADKIPYISASYAATLINPSETPYNFFVAPSYSTQMRIALRFIAEQTGGQQTDVAVFHHDSPFGQSPLEDGKRYIQSKKLKLGYQTYTMTGGATDYTALLTQAQRQGARWIVVQNVSTPAALLARDIARAGLNMKIVCLNWCGDEIFVGLAGRAAAGHYTVQPWGTTGLKVPGLKAPSAWLTARGRTLGKATVHFTQGWYTMAVMLKGVERVIASGKSVNGPNLKAALEAMPKFSTGGVTPDVKFTTRTHEGLHSSRIFQVIRGRFRQVTGYRIP
ncbi:MAG: ABC transporter substrate-binding protein [Actinobacteria bacterium]|nr:ABC transporter substrate-binding protein [Actinomycetota bacterium]